MTRPTVSVILPTHDRGDMLPRSIGSIVNQSFSDLELILVDDASRQDIRSVVDSFADERIRYIRRRHQGGPAAARNTGIKQARGTYLAFQDSDDEWLLDKLSRQVEFIGQQPEYVGLVGCGRIGYRRGRRVAPFPEPDIKACAGAAVPFQLMRSLAFAYSQTWLLRHHILETVGLFDEQILVWEDRDLFTRIAKKHEVRYQPDILVIAYRQPDSLSLRLDSRIRSFERLIEKNAAQDSPDRRLLAWLTYLLGRAQLLAGRVSFARRALYRSLRLWPWAAKPWLLLILTMLGGSTALRHGLNEAE